MGCDLIMLIHHNSYYHEAGITDDEVKDFVVINDDEYFKSTKEKLYFKLNKEQNFRKVAKSFYIFLTTHDVEKYVEIMQSKTFDNCLCHYDIKILNLFDPDL